MENKYAVLVDTCVLVSDLNAEENSHGECSSFMDYLNQNSVGVVTEPIIEAAERVIGEKFCYDAGTLCNLGDILSCLSIKKLDKGKVNDNLPRVERFYRSLPYKVNRYIAMSKSQASKKFKAYLKNTPKRFRGCLIERYKSQLYQDYPPCSSGVEAVLNRKMSTDPPSVGDAFLLAEGCTLKEECKDVVIASMDAHLSPIRWNGIVEPFISDQISKEFGIVCDSPRFIPQHLRELDKQKTKVYLKQN